eukprot:438929_1
MDDNIENLIKISVEKDLDALNMPKTPTSKLYFGFFHWFGKHPLSISMFDAIKSYILLYHSHNLYVDTTGGVVNDVNGESMYNFMVNINSTPFGSILLHLKWDVYLHHRLTVRM